jgi:hypothetical protein
MISFPSFNHSFSHQLVAPATTSTAVSTHESEIKEIEPESDAPSDLLLLAISANSTSEEKEDYLEVLLKAISTENAQIKLAQSRPEQKPLPTREVNIITKRNCKMCRTSESTLWRRGPDGEQTLCNACGLHYAKILKKERKLEAAYKSKEILPKSNRIQELLNPVQPDENRQFLIASHTSNAIQAASQINKRRRRSQLSKDSKKETGANSKSAKHKEHPHSIEKIAPDPKRLKKNETDDQETKGFVPVSHPIMQMIPSQPPVAIYSPMPIGSTPIYPMQNPFLYFPFNPQNPK